MESGDKIRFFLEEKANITEKTNKQFIVNKIGHALHDLDEVFYKFSHRKDLDMIAKSIGINTPNWIMIKHKKDIGGLINKVKNK